MWKWGPKSVRWREQQFHCLLPTFSRHIRSTRIWKRLCCSEWWKKDLGVNRERNSGTITLHSLFPFQRDRFPSRILPRNYYWWNYPCVAATNLKGIIATTATERIIGYHNFNTPRSAQHPNATHSNLTWPLLQQTSPSKAPFGKHCFIKVANRKIILSVTFLPLWQTCSPSTMTQTIQQEVLRRNTELAKTGRAIQLFEGAENRRSFEMGFKIPRVSKTEMWNEYQSCKWKGKDIKCTQGGIPHGKMFASKRSERTGSLRWKVWKTMNTNCLPIALNK